MALPADLQQQLVEVLRELDAAQDADEVNHCLDVTGGLALGLSGSRTPAKRVNALFEALASHVRQALEN
ncbi:hypothetical protein [Pseudomonas sp. Marseille-P8916]|uniref:hypothetical protein n=1 Tax=Pseudomonas sp. Marseille-P8916 TaxID=2866589 RepID=UPI001CE487FD|nr:hypothetical protein [Pseudomonas sp. Marseille-P8916]